MLVKVESIRKYLKKSGLDAFLQPINDDFFTEYTANHKNRLKWLTGFSGSFGFAVVTNFSCYFFTDSRYAIQAKQELERYWEIFDISCKKPWEVLSSQDIKAGYDSSLFTQEHIKNFKCTMLPLAQNPIDQIWRRQNTNATKIFHHPLQYSGKSSIEKCREISGDIPYFFTNPESICWLLNIRGNDLQHTPIVFCRAILYQDATVALFIENNNFTIKKQESHAKVFDMQKLEGFLLKEKKIATDLDCISQYHLDLIGKDKIVNKKDPCVLKKACKNATELQGAINCHARDAKAVCDFLVWIKSNVGCTEIDASEKLLQFRKKQPLFQFPSFKTISAFGSNGAIVHYNPTKETDKKITKDDLYLVDSGGQYLDGTTDITRTIHLGTPTAEQKFHYTLVLKAHIAIASTIFPSGTTGNQLDALARVHLWRYGLDYGHGTGHGVGSFLNVHESPQSFGSDAELKEGMIISNEPGVYFAGKYGIRLENLMYVAKLDEKFLHFKILTLVPFEYNLIDFDHLTNQEKKWLEDYHRLAISI